MASSSSSPPPTWKYDVFPSFSSEDVRKSFLSHLLEKLRRKLIITFIDNGIKRCRLIAPELLSAIRDSRISIVVFSKKYVSSTWCLNELAEIHECFKEMNQMVIPVFYELDPSHVKKQTGEFGKTFDKTCQGKTEDEKQRWIRALEEVASIAGYDSRKWSEEPTMIEQISSDVSNKLFTSSDDFRDFVGIEAHVEAIMGSKLCLESEEVRMVGILGPSGIGKSTIARALFNRLSTQFHHRTFVTSKRAVQDKKITNHDEYSMKLDWAKQLLSDILGQKDIEIESLGMVEQRLKHWKVLIVLDDVNEIKVLETLAGRTGWFGFGSRIVVVTQDRALLESHDIDLIYDVDFPSEKLALQMFCQSAFGQTSPPDGFMELAAEVVKLAGNLPLGLNVLGSALRKKDKEYWVEMMPRLCNGKIEKTLRLSYDGLDAKDQEIFLYIACVLNGHKVKYIRNVVGDRANIGLRMLNDKSLIHITSSGETVMMHNLLQMLGREIVREESIYNPGKRQFLVDAEDICDVFSDKTGTEAVLGICFNTSEINGPLFLDENPFQGMYNLRFLKVYMERSRKSGEGRLYLPQGLVYLPRKLRILYWDECPLKCLPSNFKAEFLVKLSMINSKLEKLWEATQPLRSLKKMSIAGSTNLKEIPDLSYAINLENMDLFKCRSLVALPSSIQHLKKLVRLSMSGCSKLELLPSDVNLEYLKRLDMVGCSRLRSFPKISKNISSLFLDGTAIEEEDSLWIENISGGFTFLYWNFCSLRCLPSNFRPESLTLLFMKNSKLEKLWEGVQSLGNLRLVNLSGSENLKEFPNLSKATRLMKLRLNDCKSLVTVPCSIRSLNQLHWLSMRGCTGLESLPTNLNMESLRDLNLSGCSQLKSFPQISRNIVRLSLNDTAIEEVPSWIKYFSYLETLEMRGCKRLKNISPNIFELKWLEKVDFSDCEGVTEFGDAEIFKSPETHHTRVCLNFDNCFNLDQKAEKLIIQSDCNYAVLPGGQVPEYFTHRACGSSLTIPLPKSSLLEEDLGFKVCIVLEPLTVTEYDLPCIVVRWYLRGETGVHVFHFDRASIKWDNLKMDHLFVFHFGFDTEEGMECPSKLDLDSDDVKFDFYYRTYGCSHCRHHTEACPYSVQRIKGCGIQLWDVSPSRNDSDDDENIEGDSSSSRDDSVLDVEEYLQKICIDDNYKSWSSSDEEEFWEEFWNHDYSTADELNFPTFFDEEEEEEEEEEEDSPDHLTDDDEWNFSSFFGGTRTFGGTSQFFYSY